MNRNTLTLPLAVVVLSMVCSTCCSTAKADLIGAEGFFRFDLQGGSTTATIAAGNEFTSFASPVATALWEWTVDVSDTAIDATATVTAPAVFSPRLDFGVDAPYSITNATISNTLPVGAFLDILSAFPGSTVSGASGNTISLVVNGFGSPSPIGTTVLFHADLVTTAVPEPSAFLFLSLASAGAFGLRRRKRGWATRQPI